MSQPEFQRQLEDYIVFMERLSRRSLPMLDSYAAADIRFIDPFNNLTGVEPMRSVLGRLFSLSDRPLIRVTDRAWGRDGHTAYLRWAVTILQQEKPGGLAINGISEISFGSDGLIVSQVNHWDSGSQIIAQHPLGRWLWKGIAGRMSD